MAPRPIEPLSPAEVEELASARAATSNIGARDAALILFLSRTGARIGETLALCPKDIDTARGTVRFLTPKGGAAKARTVAIDPGTLAAIERWALKRTALGIPSRAPLFCTLKGGPLKRQQVAAMLKRRAERAGVEKRVHPHGLRHSAAAEAVRRGVNVETVRRQLGHTSLAVTARYLQTFGEEESLAAWRGMWAEDDA